MACLPCPQAGRRPPLHAVVKASREASDVVRGMPMLFINGVLHQAGYATGPLLQALKR